MTKSLEELSLTELESLVREAPWFSYARYLLLCKLASLGMECFLSGVRSSLIFLPDRERLLSTLTERYGLTRAARSGAYAMRRCVPDAPVEEVASGRETTHEPEEMVPFGLLEIEFQEEGRQAAERPYIVGGDYFTPADFAALQNRQENLSLNYGRSAGEERGSATDAPAAQDYSSAKSRAEASGELPQGADALLCTETLASIYAQQGYYQQAIDVYSKLSLLYPEKSAYFATLAKEIKAKKE